MTAKHRSVTEVVNLAGLASVGVATFLFAASAAHGTSFRLAPMDLGSGFTLTGSVRTNGAIGALSASDIAGWNLKVTAVTDTTYTPGNTRNASSLVNSTGSQLLVPTALNASNDGGSLSFYGGHRFQVQVADFTGANSRGGQAFYVAGSAFDFLPLHQPNGAEYVVADVATPGGSVFNLAPKRFGGGVVMSGTITTDGAVGAAAITDWNVLVRDTQQWAFNPNNSQVQYSANLVTDGRSLTVTPFDIDGNPGMFSIGGFAHYDFNGVLLGDFSYDPGGVAGFISPFAYQTISPVPLDQNGNFVVGVSVPEPYAWALMVLGVGCVGVALRSGRRPGVARQFRPSGLRRGGFTGQD